MDIPISIRPQSLHNLSGIHGVWRLNYESILGYIGSVDSVYSKGLQGFYQKCLALNRPANHKIIQILQNMPIKYR